MDNKNTLSVWYLDGFRSGKLDKKLGYRSEYTWHMGHDNPLLAAYSKGYKDAQTTGTENNPYLTT